ncbi:helix-turn-helix transcriptional regulator [Gloeocapsopsis crepidinum LEGE 06123]|uniref:Helix-turn-helix transcriptional regulator n=1 Tax=Gloeocapsopsis crepidinum LEGE 06123 TaxID=588587 RepID=A0ABR9UKW3_9CHRO|nr:AraC family transcriptional regulator [Gloeocapsopsis crepidinum]MBE9188931.1 helix-turn-helix transcriptional regulator [Gloeocapsopsis crepidinum LEGE 06123]
MTIVYTDAQWDEIREEGLQTGKIIDQADDVESISIWQHPLRKGLVSETLLCLGLQTEIYQFEYPEIYGHEYLDSCDPPVITLVFRSAGVWTEQIFGVNEDACEQPGESYLFYYSAGTREIEKKMAGRDVNVRIRIEPQMLRLLSRGQEESLPCLLKPFLATDTPPSFYQSLGNITPATQVALQQLLQCPFQGIMRRTYLEAKTLELITLQLAQLFNDGTHSYQKANLKSSDIERIYQARDILIQNSSNPPSLVELAQRVQLNDRKLKQGFRQIFGTTVFGYLHDYRLEKACQLLIEDRMNVSEVSYAVGFANRGYFAAAFRKKFGINPSDYQAQWRKKSA